MTTKSNSSSGEQETGEREPRVWLHMVDADCWFCYHLAGEDDPRFLTEYVPAATVVQLERERDALRLHLGNILQCFRNGAMPHRNIVEAAEAALGGNK